VSFPNLKKILLFPEMNAKKKVLKCRAQEFLFPNGRCWGYRVGSWWISPYEIFPQTKRALPQYRNKKAKGKSSIA